MKTDDRDERLASILDEAVHDIAVGPPGAPVSTVSGIGRAVRVIAAVAAAAVFVAGAVFASGQFGRDRRPGDDVPSTVVEGSFETDKWQLERPSDWITAPFEGCGTLLPRGVIVSNVEFEFLNPQGQVPSCSDRLVLAGFPSDGVVFDLEPSGVRWGISHEPLSDTPLPIGPSQLLVTDGIVGGPRVSYSHVVVEGVSTAIVRLWVGPDASPGHVEAAHRILGSMRIEGADRWVDEVFDSHGVRVSVTRPEDWTVDTFDRLGVADAPNPVMSLTSPDAGGDASRVCGPHVLFAPTKLPPDGVAIVVSNAASSWIPPDVGPRPDVLSPATAIRDRTNECPTGTFRKLRFAFDVAGKPILVDVVMDSIAEKEPSPIVWRILESLDFPAEASPPQEPVELPSPVRDFRSEFVSAERGYRFWPRSGRAERGVVYRFEVPHCGLGWLVDFDGSFWEGRSSIFGDDWIPADEIPDGDIGTIEFVGHDGARYEASDGTWTLLSRIDGPVVRQPCD